MELRSVEGEFERGETIRGDRSLVAARIETHPVPIVVAGCLDEPHSPRIGFLVRDLLHLTTANGLSRTTGPNGEEIAYLEFGAPGRYESVSCVRVVHGPSGVRLVNDIGSQSRPASNAREERAFGWIGSLSQLDDRVAGVKSRKDQAQDLAGEVRITGGEALVPSLIRDENDELVLFGSSRMGSAMNRRPRALAAEMLVRSESSDSVSIFECSNSDNPLWVLEGTGGGTVPLWINSFPNLVRCWSA